MACSNCSNASDRCCDDGIYINPSGCEQRKFNWMKVCELFNSLKESSVMQLNEIWDGSQTSVVLPALDSGTYGSISFLHEGIEFSLDDGTIDYSEVGDKSFTTSINSDGTVTITPAIPLGAPDYKCRVTVKYTTIDAACGCS